jgi:hypothetical protein
MRRIFGLPRAAGSLGTSSRGCARQAAIDLLTADERQQAAMEAALHSRSVIFATGGSSDHRPRIAAAEAYDLAATALPRPPNFCMMNISLDNALMVDAPEVVWYSLCKSNGLGPSSGDAKVKMIGSAVAQQRVGHGYIQVTLGIIPDLEMDVFTFDSVPTKEQVATMSSTKPFACIAHIDSALAIAHEAAIMERIGQLASALPAGCALSGAVLPPTRPVARDGPNVESLFFINDRVYKGSAAAAILRSNRVAAHTVSVLPGISVGSATASGIEAEGLVRRISLLNGEKATDVIRTVYEKELADNETSKVFIAVRHGNGWLPLTFKGDVATGTLSLCLPVGAELGEGQTVEFFVDDLSKDIESAAGLLMQHVKKVPPVSMLKDVTIAREGRRNVTASSCAAFHYSHRLMNVIGRQSSDVLTLSSEGSVIFAPSVLSRCVGSQVATGGIYCPGVIVAVEGAAGIGARSCSFLMLEGLN